MSKYKFLLIIPLIAVMLAAWYIVGSNNGTKLKKQRELLAQAAAYAEDKIYVKAVPLAVEAYGIDTEIKYTEVEDILMEYYQSGGYTEEYFSMINDRINGGRAEKEEYLGLAQYYFNEREKKSGLSVLAKGIVKFDGDKLPAYYGIKGLTGQYSGEELFSDELTQMYEKNRYSYSRASFSFKNIGSADNDFFTVMDTETGLWGIYSSSGKQLTEHIYSEATNVSANGYASVKLGDEYILINSEGVRYALCKDESVTGLVRTEGKNKTVVMCSDGKMHMASDLIVSEKGYDFLGAASEGFRALCTDGKWSFFGDDDNKLEVSCEEIKVNSCGEAVVSGRAFIKTDGSVKLINTSGEIYDNSFEDAKPFCAGGSLAAVRMNGKWGFADKNGNVVIDCIYEDANSFCSKNAGFVQCDDGMWRLIDVRGNIIDKYEFFEAREFRGSSAAVKSLEDKWSLLTIS
ncbi:MAG: WG repeat-containing protein [Huintestinicola sp.]|uniref:WG repeat-containing protein n=1 Tax=Huintestinicola sp. TaxID=2981661 RepID=UPI003F01D735